MEIPHSPVESIVDLPFSELRKAIHARSISAQELTEASIDRAHETESLHAWSYLDEEGALKQARLLDDEARSGSFRGPLHGMPIGFKDNIGVAGMPFELGCDAYNGRVASEDSAIASRIRNSGGIPLGINVMHALGLGNAVRYGHRATSRHPWNDEYVPGGSSCGSAVATAARSCVISIGGDTGGSVRGPASSCGVVGFKPTWRRLDGQGTGHFSWSMDTLGVFGRGIEGVTAALRAGFANMRDLSDAVGQIRIGVLSDDSYRSPSREVLAAMTDIRHAITDNGHVVTDVGRVELEPAMDIWQARLAEMYAVFAADEVVTPERVPASLLGLIRHAATIPVKQYVESWTRGEALSAALDKALESVDAILLPATPERALSWERWKTSGEPGSDVTSWYSYLIPFNVTGHPAVTIPWALDEDSMPCAFQLIGRRGDDERVLEIGEELQLLSPWEDLRPINTYSAVS